MSSLSCLHSIKRFKSLIDYQFPVYTLFLLLIDYKLLTNITVDMGVKLTMDSKFRGLPANGEIFGTYNIETVGSQ